MWNCLRGRPKDTTSKPSGEYPQNPVRRKLMWLQEKIPATTKAVADFDADDVGRRLRADVAAINPNELNRFEAMAAAQLDLNYKALGLFRSPTEAGTLNMNMQDIRRYASGVINNTVRLKEVERLKQLVSEARNTLEAFGIKGDAFREAFADIVHYGSILQRTEKMSSEIARSAAMLDYNKFHANLLSKGVDQESINKLIRTAQDYAGIKEEVDALAKTMGVDIGSPDALEAFPRILTPEIVQRIATKEFDETLFEQVLQGHIPFNDLLRNEKMKKYLPAKTTEVMAARLNEYWKQAAATNKSLEKSVPTNLETLNKQLKENASNLSDLKKKLPALQRKFKEADTLAKNSARNASRGKKGFIVVSNEQRKQANDIKKQLDSLKKEIADRQNLSKKIKADIRSAKLDSKLGRELDVMSSAKTVDATKLDELLDNPLEFRRWLRQNVKPQVLDKLVEEGLFVELPFSSTEMLDYMRDIYKLPGTTKIKDVLELDPLKVLDDYTQRLARSAANSELFNYVRRDGVRDGWAITKEMMQDIAEGRLSLDGINVNDFVRLGDIEWKKLGIDPQSIKVADFYMHKDAAGLLKSILFTSANPYMMSNLSGAIMKVSSYLRLSILGGQLWKFANRVTLGNIFQLLHATDLNPMAIASWTRNFIDVSRALSGKGLEAFDDVKPFIEIGGKTYTRRGAASELLRYRSSDALPLTPGEIIKGSYSAGKSTLENAKDFAFNLLSPITGIHKAAMFAQFASKPGKMEPIKFAANFGKYYWRHGIIQGLETVMAPMGGFANMSDVVTRMALMDVWRHTKQFDSFADLARLSDEYVVSPDSGGAFTKTWGSVVQPFARFAFWNLPATIRHATANPHEFVSYQKILSFLNRSAQSNCPTAESEVSKYQLEGYPLLLGCEGGNRVMLNIANFEGQLDALNYLDETAQGLAGLFGYYLPTATSAQMREQLLEKDKGFAKALRSQLGNSYFKGLAEYMIGEDLDTGEKFDDNKQVTWLGVQMSPRLRALAQAALPFPDQINRMNPGGVFGRAELRDAGGNVIRPEQTSIFGTRRTDKDRQYDDVVAKNKTLSVLRNFAGLNLGVANQALQLQYTDRDMQRSVEEGKKQIATLRNKFVDDYPKMGKEERDRRSAQIEELAESVALIEFDYARLQAYMYDKNVLPSEALNKLREVERTENSLQMLNDGVPYPDLKVQGRILEDYYKSIEGLRNNDNTEKR